jgi:spore maturation protein CgeB
MSRLVFLGLSLSSSWGNGHATTYRALLRGLAALGHDCLFLERDQPWYRDNRDLPDPDFAELVLYHDPAEIEGRLAPAIAAADAVIIGSYVPEGRAVARIARRLARGPLAFYDIDTPVTLARLVAGDCDYLDRDLVPLFDLYLSFTGGPVLDRLEREHGARKAVMLPCGVDPDLYRPFAVERRWDLGHLGTYSADRQPMLERLLLEPARRRPDLRFVVAGPQYPAGIDWPANVERIAHLAPADHPAFYAAQAFTLNVTRADMVATGWAPSVRLFETAACATPAISDRWSGLEDFFRPGESILVADTAEDVLAALAAGPVLRDRLAAAARREALARHTGHARARTLVAALAAVAPARIRAAE